MTYLTIFKTFFGGLFSFLFTTRLGLIITGITLIVIAVAYSHSAGYNSGVRDTRTALKVEYQKQLDEQLEEQREAQAKIHQESIDFILKNNTREIEYRDTIKVIEKLVKSEPQLIKQECGLPKEKLKEFNEALKQIK